MPRTVTQIIYEKKDYEKLKEMPISEVIYTLKWIDRGWIGNSRYNGRDDFEGDEDDYDKYKMHQALKFVIEHFARIKKIGEKNRGKTI